MLSRSHSAEDSPVDVSAPSVSLSSDNVESNEGPYVSSAEQMDNNNDDRKLVKAYRNRDRVEYYSTKHECWLKGDVHVSKHRDKKEWDRYTIKVQNVAAERKVQVSRFRPLLEPEECVDLW